MLFREVSLTFWCETKMMFLELFKLVTMLFYKNSVKTSKEGNCIARGKEASVKNRTQRQFIFVNPNTREEFVKGLQTILVSKLLLLKFNNQPISKEKGSTCEGGA